MDIPAVRQLHIALSRFIGVTGQAYELQRSTDLITWIVLETVLPASGGTIPLTDPAPPSVKAFYRIKATP